MFHGQNRFKIISGIEPICSIKEYDTKLCTGQVLCWMLHYGQWASCIKTLEFELLDVALDIGPSFNCQAEAMRELRRMFEPLKIKLVVIVTGQNRHY